MKTKITLFIVILISFSGFSQKTFWEASSQSVEAEMIPDNRMPSSYLTYNVDLESLKQYLIDAPSRFDNVDSNIIFQMPDENGNILEFKVYKSGTLAPDLAKDVPQIQTYRAYGITDKTMVASITTTVFGLHIGVLRPGLSTLVVQPATSDLQTYIVYSKDKQSAPEFTCGVTETYEAETLSDNFQRPMVNDGILRKYRFAVGTTGEYSTFYVNRAINNGTLTSGATDAQKKDVILAAVAVTVDRLNTVYEVDFGVFLELVTTERNAIFLDASSDPYDNSDISQIVNANTSAINTVIGSANYDGGHCFTTNPGGGLSGLGIICGNNKAASATGLSSPIGDHYDIDFVAHEVGHAFGANHTFANANQRNLPTSIEPGSGSTIMAYAGVSAPNVQMNSDDYFSVASIIEIGSYLSSGATCSQNVNLGNHAPVITVTGFGSVKIPKSTPFILEASANDQDGDILTYCWEEKDIVTNQSITSYRPTSTYTSGPMFRSYSPVSEGFRMFPKVNNILDGSYHNEWEVLASVARVYNFAVTVRDNHVGGGQSPYSYLAIEVDGNAGPFRVTSQASNETWSVGSTQNIAWNVAGTDANQVNCSAVDIYFSTDDGVTFPHLIASNLPNNGNATITIPSGIDTTSGRLMVRGHNNYFFDLAKGSIMVGSYQTQCNTTNSASNLGIAIPDGTSVQATTTLNVTDSYTISDVNISVNISHGYVRDLRIIAESPQGTEVVLWSHNCGNQDNVVITFDDSGSALDCSNLTGTHVAVGSLSDFAGENCQGTWTLKVDDNYSGTAGTINNWSVEVCQTVNVNENTISNLKVWPNPTQNNVNIAFDVKDTNSNINVSLFDLSGREIFSNNYETEADYFNKNIGINDLSKGLYLLKIKNGKYMSTQKLFIK